MTYKKTWFSYLLWAFYTCAAGVMLADYAIIFWQKNSNAAIGYDTAVFVFLVFAGVAGCYFLIRKAVAGYCRQDKTKEKHKMDSRMAYWGEALIVLGIVLAAFFYRLCLYLQSAPDGIVLTQYYHAATVKTGEGIAPAVHGASHLYTLCLSFVLSFLGNKADAAVWFQIFMQMLTLLFAFFAVKKIAGRIPAGVAMLALALSSAYAERIFALTPECFFFLLYAAGLLIIGSYIKMYCHGNHTAAAGIAGAVFTGIVIGMLCYLDAVSFTLLFLLPALFTGVQKRREVSAVFFMLTASSGILAFIGALAADAFYSHAGVWQTAQAWFSLYRSHIKADYIFYRTDRSLIECFILVIFAAFLIMAFWNCKKRQNASFWIWLMFLLAPTPLTATGVLPYQAFSIFIWSVLAGIGLQQSFVWEGKKVVKTAESIQTIDGNKSIAEMDAPAPSRFIENPLPLPKKHEKKEMDYQYAVAEENMKFDVEIKEDDDFDIS